MCGICGFLSPVAADPERARPVLGAMVETLAHRGPECRVHDVRGDLGGPAFQVMLSDGGVFLLKLPLF